jgi:hypothetical protein
LDQDAELVAPLLVEASLGQSRAAWDHKCTRRKTSDGFAVMDRSDPIAQLATLTLNEARCGSTRL